MDQPLNDPLLGTLQLAVLIASLSTWFVLVTRWRRGQPPLEYEPRSPVPWGAPIAMLAVLFVAIALLTPQGAGADAGQTEGPNPIEVGQRLVGFILFQSAVIGCVLFLTAVLYRPTLRDLGLPVYGEEIGRDVWIGIVACAAALTPVYGVQLLMLFLSGLLDKPPGHPLIRMVTNGGPNIGVVLLASIAAVVVAPISEEILFRLLLQGWLEKWEDRQWGWRSKSLPEPTLSDAIPELETDGVDDEARMTNGETPDVDDSTFVTGHSSFDSPPSHGLAGLPHGWLPILLSSLLFALAHFGYGPDPIAIFFLALVLGYVYQRTHRILPCMVAHALFNSVAMLILWRAVYLSAE